MKIVILVVATISTLSYCWTKTEILSDEFIIHQPETDDQGGQSKQKVLRVNVPVIPDAFDGRTYWSQCESLKDIRDQGNCGSCWAFKFQFSAEDVLSCGTDCGDGCDGDYPLDAWIYWKNWDIVSGGDYKSQQVSPSRNGSINIETSL
jgi:cathepsin B